MNGFDYDCCSNCEREKDKQLHTDEMVCGYCLKWLVECEAVYLAKLTLEQRRAFLASLEEKRGVGSTDELKKVLTGIFYKGKKVNDQSI